MILAENVQNWNNALVEIINRYYVVPGSEEELCQNWMIGVIPFEDSSPREEKRENTDKTLEKIVEVVREYSKNQPV